MSTESFDPVQYKAGQRQTWDSVAAGWNKWWSTWEQGAQGVSDRLVELAQIRPGDQVLDIATGIGEPAFTATRQVGPTGRVVATDQAPQMLAIARERALALGFQNVELCNMDAERLEFADNTFNAILCRWGLMFLPNLAASLISMRRLLAPGGRLAAATWSVPARVPFISLPMAAIRQVVPVAPTPEGTPNTFGLSDPAALEHAFVQAGFTEVRSELLTMTLEFPSCEALTSFQLEVSGSINAMLASHPPEKRAEARQTIEAAAAQHANADGSVSLANEVICVVGRR